ncbi:MAG: dienelactone hydrolase family protein [Bacteroidia bacterium]
MKTSEITIHINENIALRGNLNVPSDPAAFVIFSHGSGSSRFSTRNRQVAETLNSHNIATLLTDLLTEEEDRIYENRFNINLLTDRLVAVTDYSSKLSDMKNLNVGYFGASTGAASALKASARIPELIQAVVSRGGRPDLAADSLSKVKAPTLLIVGGLDTDVITLNKEAYSKLNCEKDLRIVKGATHLFEEPNKLNEVADLAVDWFNKHLVLTSTLTK